MLKNETQPNSFQANLKKIKKTLSNKNFLTLIYKLLHDTFFILLFSFTLILIAEGLLPGIASSHLSLAKLAIGLLATLGGIIAIGRKIEYVYPKTRLNKSKLLPFLIIMSFLLIGTSLLRFALWENILITILTLFFFILFYHLLFLNEK